MVTEERIQALRTFLQERELLDEIGDLEGLLALIEAFPDLSLREVYIAGFGLALHYLFADDLDRAKQAAPQLQEWLNQRAEKPTWDSVMEAVEEITGS
ncbi:MAG: hypothetical protein ACE5JP_12650 [Candidatus Bipolaricaulia bacterium]